MGLGIWEIIAILVIVLLLFGTKKIANIGSDLGAAIKGFKKSMRDGEEEVKTESKSDDNKKA